MYLFSLNVPVGSNMNMLLNISLMCVHNTCDTLMQEDFVTLQCFNLIVSPQSKLSHQADEPNKSTNSCLQKSENYFLMCVEVCQTDNNSRVRCRTVKIQTITYLFILNIFWQIQT